MSKNPSPAEFIVGQQIVYPLQGVGQITTIENREFKGKDIAYYVIYLPVSDMIIRMPVSTAVEQGIRAIVSQKEAEKTLEYISPVYEPVSTDWKLRYQMNLDLLRQGNIMDIAIVVTQLYHRSKIKELPILERKLYDNASSLLFDEMALSLGKEKNEMRALIFAKLEAKE